MSFFMGLGAGIYITLLFEFVVILCYAIKFDKNKNK